MAATRIAKVIDDQMEPAAPGGVSSNANPAKAPAAAADDSGEMMQAVAWQGKNNVRGHLFPSSHGGSPHTYTSTSTQIQLVQVPKPKLMDAEDAVIKITGTTVCGR